MHLVVGCLFTSLNNRGNYPRSFLDTMKKKFPAFWPVSAFPSVFNGTPSNPTRHRTCFLRMAKKTQTPKTTTTKKNKPRFFAQRRKKKKLVKTFPGGRIQLRCWRPTSQLVHRARRTTRGQDPSDRLVLPRTRTTLP